MDDKELINQQTILISELLIKVSTLENVLIKKNLLSKDEVEQETKLVISQLTNLVKENTKKFVEKQQ